MNKKRQFATVRHGVAGTERAEVMVRMTFGPNQGITARTWDAATGRPRVKLAGHSSWVNALAYTPSGDMIGTGSGDGTART